jgi:hypothetical protein
MRSRLLTLARTIGAVLGCVLVYAACSKSATGPQGLDPTLLIRTHSLQGAIFTWRDGQGIIGTDTIPQSATTRCERFTARPDSAYWELTSPDTVTLPWWKFLAPWFDPSTRPFWTVDLTGPYGGGPIVRDTTALPC